MSDKKFTGIFGIWPWPILNALLSIADNDDEDDSFSFKEYNVVRDDDGRIDRVEIIKGDSND